MAALRDGALAPGGRTLYAANERSDLVTGLNVDRPPPAGGLDARNGQADVRAAGGGGIGLPGEEPDARA